jgi:cellobiose phosphorylase
MFHLLHVEGTTLGRPSFETSRRRFLGPEQSLEHPRAMRRQGELSGTPGRVDDPMVGVRQQFVLAAEESAVINIVTGAAGSRADALAAVGRFRDPRLIERALDLSRTYSQLRLQRLGMTEADARFYTRLASPLLFDNGCLDRVHCDIARQSRGTKGLAALGIHPGRPIVLACVSDLERLGVVEQLLGAHAYWRSQGLETSLVVWLEGNVKCADYLYERILALVALYPGGPMRDRPGGIFVRRGDRCAAEHLPALRAAARLFLDGKDNSLENHARAKRPATFALDLHSLR